MKDDLGPPYEPYHIYMQRQLREHPWQNVLGALVGLLIGAVIVVIDLYF